VRRNRRLRLERDLRALQRLRPLLNPIDPTRRKEEAMYDPEHDEEAAYCWICGDDGHTAGLSCMTAADML